MIPRPYQSRMVSRVVSALEAHGETLAVSPTGSGKSIILSMLAGEMTPAKTLVLQHRDELVSQTLTKFQKVHPGMPVSLYTAEVKSWRGNAVFAMVQTLSREENLQRIPGLDLLIVDEAHHCMAPSYRRVIDTVRDRNPGCRIAGFTATPNRGDGKGLRSVFSNCADQVTIKELIDHGFLLPPRGFVIDLKGIREQLSKVRKVAGDFDMDEVEAVMNTRVVNEEVVKQWKEKAVDRRTIVFCSTVEHASAVTKAFADAGVSAAMVTGETPGPLRAKLLQQLDSGEVQVMVNVAVLTEGFDSPTVSCIVLLRPCSFKSTMMLMIGRGLRTVNPELHPGIFKKDCVVLDFGASLLTHGDILTSVDLDGREPECGEAPMKLSPDPDYGDSPYHVPDVNGNHGCGALVPAAVKECPLCGFFFERIAGEKPAFDVVLTELDLLNSSPFRWVDLFGSGKVMIASGFDAWAGVFSPDGENWHALGKEKESRAIQRVAIGDRIRALAAADDFLRERETGDSANKSKQWLRDSATQKQRELLRQVGYQMDNFDFNFTKYSAAAHLTFQWNRRQIEAAIFRRVAA